tara:strand:- start:12908 stop:13333 length:426 start_codon:yes stop_codon:yes gene_type:complete
MSLPPKMLPDRWVRKAIYSSLITLGVNVYDTNTGTDSPSEFVLMTTQTNNQIMPNKCDSRWTSSILLDVITRYPVSGNSGNRLPADIIAENVLSLTTGLNLDPTSGLKILKQSYSFPNDISTKTNTEIVYRKLIRIELEIE